MHDSPDPPPPAEPPSRRAAEPPEPPQPPSPADLAWAGRLMREQTGASWLVPLLAPPLAEVVASPILADADLTRVFRDPAEVRSIWAALAPRLQGCVARAKPMRTARGPRGERPWVRSP